MHQSVVNLSDIACQASAKKHSILIPIEAFEGLGAADRGRYATLFTRKRMTFVNTTVIAYGQKIGRSLMILAVCNSSCVHKCHAFASRTGERPPEAASAATHGIG